ncbi:MAG: peptidyl-prolyl cis-trans isomerase [Campylobacter sp.]|uniref:peptidylprolyl isomerase n=1 Tax=Campylobacter concisus TaxID=199 RepID=UPI000D3031B6|nr:peptidylprolyl isomerase [Campylobacter concisus]RKV90443.1 MAG: peptidyl-prolyl cis-trans isomerase [Campylobacter sp.]
MKKLLFLAAGMLSALNLYSAQMINGIAAIVENEPITLYEVYSLKEQLRASEQDALNLLIRDRLEDAQIKNLNISVTPFELNDRIESIAKQNGMTNSQFRSSIQAQGMDFLEFKNNIEKKMLQEKLYKSILAEAGKNVNEQKAKMYFDANPDKFKVFSTAKVVLYRAKNPEELEAQKTSPSLLSSVQTQELSLDYQSIDPRLAAIISGTNNGEFTQILQGADSFDMFYVKEKIGSYTPSFADVKDNVINELYQGEQEKLMADYFDKLRAKAKIQILR